MSDHEHWEYFRKKAVFAGILLAAILHGVVIILYFRCMRALFSYTYRSMGNIKWGLVALTTSMFSCSTIAVVININAISSSFIGPVDQGYFILPGPLGSVVWSTQNGVAIAFTVMIVLNQWQADGLLLYRCHAICGMNYWVIALPCLLYLASVAMGISFVIENSKPLLPSVSVLYKVIPAYIAINFTLNVILTLMIVGRLALRSKQIRDIMGPWSGAGDWYKRIAVMFVESCALYAISLLVYLIAYTRNTPLVDIFYQVFIETQVIAPFLIILRIAKRTAVTSHATLFPETQVDHADQMDFSSQGETTVVGGNLSDRDYRSQGETTVVSGNLYDKDFMDALDARYGGAPKEKELGAGVGAVTGGIEEVPLLKP